MDKIDERIKNLIEGMPNLYTDCKFAAKQLFGKKFQEQYIYTSDGIHYYIVTDGIGQTYLRMNDVDIIFDSVL